MSGTVSGWGQPNVGAMAGYMGYGSNLAGLQQMQLASMTPEQQQAYRQQMYGMALMNQANSQPQRSGWGAMNQAFSPVLGAAMLRYGQNQQPTPQTPQGYISNPVTGFTPNAAGFPSITNAAAPGGASMSGGFW